MNYLLKQNIELILFHLFIYNKVKRKIVHELQLGLYYLLKNTKIEILRKTNAIEGYSLTLCLWKINLTGPMEAPTHLKTWQSIERSFPWL